jgi:hypothetical protein
MLRTIVHRRKKKQPLGFKQSTVLPPDFIQRLLVCFVDSDQEEEIFLCLLALRRSCAHGAPGEPWFIHYRVTFLAETDFTTIVWHAPLLGRFVCILNTGYAEAVGG